VEGRSRVVKSGLIDVLTGYFGDSLRVESVSVEDRLTQSVIANLERLFNARRGELVHLPDFGLPDVTEIYRDMPDSLGLLKGAVENVIAKYEPRLRNLRLVPQPSDPYRMQLVFVLTAELADRTKVRFETVFSSHELVDVRQGRLE